MPVMSAWGRNGRAIRKSPSFSDALLEAWAAPAPSGPERAAAEDQRSRWRCRDDPGRRDRRYPADVGGCSTVQVQMGQSLS